MAGQPKRRAKEEAERAAAARELAAAQAAAGVYPSVVAQTIAAVQPPRAMPMMLPARSFFPGMGGPSVKRPKVTAFDPPPVVVAPAAAGGPPPAAPAAVSYETSPTPAPETAPDPPAGAPAPAPPPPVPVAPPPAFAAATSNGYAEQYHQREHERWAKSKQVPVPDISLGAAWILAIRHYPPQALTIWLRRTQPTQAAYEFYVSGDELVGDPFPDRRLFETVRRKRRQPTIAESFVGRIRGNAADGNTYDVGFGEIHLPPEEPQAPATAWGTGAAPPPGWTGYPGGAPPYGMPPSYGAPPGYPGGWGGAWGAPPYGHPYVSGPYFMPQPAAPATPPASVAADPAMLEVWRLAQEASANVQRMMYEAQQAQSKSQSDLMAQLFARLLQPTAAPAGQGGLLESLKVLKDVVGLVDTVRGKGSDDGASGAGVTIHSLSDGTNLVTDKHGVDTVTTAVLGLKQGFETVAKAVGKSRAAAAAGAGASSVSGGLSGASVKRNLAPGAAPAASTPAANGTGQHGAPS